MQYDVDINGEFAEIFKTIRKILLSYPNITEQKNAKQTSYRDEYSMVVMMRTRKDTFVVAFGKGAKLQKRFPMLQSSGKIVRHLYFKSIDEVDETLLKEIIEESFILNMEAFEMRKLRCSLG